MFELSNDPSVQVFASAALVDALEQARLALYQLDRDAQRDSELLLLIASLRTAQAQANNRDRRAAQAGSAQAS